MWIVFVLIAVLVALLIALGRSSSGEGDESSRLWRPGEAANDYAGRVAESEVNATLRELLRDDEYLLTNLLLPLKNGHKTEIDAVLISRKGIFCIETKSWIGAISGNDDDEYWVQTYMDDDTPERKHRNPVKQNKNHCRALKEVLKGRFTIENVVIFVDLEDGDGIGSDYVYEVDDFVEEYNYSDDVLTTASVESVYQKLKSFVATNEELIIHKREVKDSHKR